MKILCNRKSERDYEMSLMERVTEQIDWNVEKLGKIEYRDVDMDYIEEVAEDVLDPLELMDFLNFRLAREVYQSY